jgi:hypothetical protein
MFKMKKYTSFLSGIAWIVLMGTTVPMPSSANDVSVLCANRNMTTEVALSTADFNAAFCSTGYYKEEPGCYVPTKYFYVGQSRKSGESIILSNATWSVENGIRVYRARNGIYTYQIATSGAYSTKGFWRTLSVFKNEQRIYHKKVDGYFGYWDC